MFKKIVALTLIVSAGNFATANPMDGTTLTDAQVSKVLITINEGEIDAGKIAKDKAQTAPVKDFAKMMIVDHKKNEDDTKEMGKKLKGNADSNLAKILKEDAKNSNKDLKKNDKNAIDQAYVAQQVTMHEKALTVIKDNLIPSATDEGLKSHLQQTSAAVQKHLEHAKSLQTK